MVTPHSRHVYQHTPYTQGAGNRKPAGAEQQFLKALGLRLRVKGLGIRTLSRVRTNLPFLLRTNPVQKRNDAARAGRVHVWGFRISVLHNLPSQDTLTPSLAIHHSPCKPPTQWYPPLAVILHAGLEGKLAAKTLEQALYCLILYLALSTPPHLKLHNAHNSKACSTQTSRPAEPTSPLLPKVSSPDTVLAIFP